MSEYTTEELIKANRVHADLQAGCQECQLYEERVCTSPNLQTYSAERLVSQQNEIADLKKQIAETYTAEQFSKDLAKYFDSREIDYPLGILMVKDIKRWYNEIPEKPKVTNGDKFREVFGHKNRSHLQAVVPSLAAPMKTEINTDGRKYWITSEWDMMTFQSS